MRWFPPSAASLYRAEAACEVGHRGAKRISRQLRKRRSRTVVVLEAPATGDTASHLDGVMPVDLDRDRAVLGFFRAGHGGSTASCTPRRLRRPAPERGPRVWCGP